MAIKDFAQGIAVAGFTALGVEKLTDKAHELERMATGEVSEEEYHKSAFHTLLLYQQAQHELLEKIADALAPEAMGDIEESILIPVYPQSLQLSRFGRPHSMLYVKSSINLFIEAPNLGQFTISGTAVGWNQLDLPDGVRISIPSGGNPVTALYRVSVNAVGTANPSSGGGGAMQLLDSAGTNKATIDASGNLQVKGGYVELSGLSASALNADLVPSTDVSAYKWLSLHVSGTYSGTVSFQASNDTVNWANVMLMPAGGFSSGQTSTTSANIIYGAPVQFRFFRVRMTGYTSGTVNGTLELYTSPASLTYIGVNANQNGTWNVGMSPNTSGGTSDYHVVSAASTNAANVKSSAGQVYGWDAYNAAASVRYIKLYNKSTAPVPGTDTPIRTIAIPAGQKAFNVIENGMPFSNGIGIAIVAGIADSDATVISASDVVLDLDYK